MKSARYCQSGGTPKRDMVNSTGQGTSGRDYDHNRLFNANRKENWPTHNQQYDTQISKGTNRLKTETSLSKDNFCFNELNRARSMNQQTLKQLMTKKPIKRTSILEEVTSSLNPIEQTIQEMEDSKSHSLQRNLRVEELREDKMITSQTYMPKFQSYSSRMSGSMSDRISSHSLRPELACLNHASTQAQFVFVHQDEQSFYCRDCKDNLESKGFYCMSLGREKRTHDINNLKDLLTSLEKQISAAKQRCKPKPSFEQTLSEIKLNYRRLCQQLEDFIKKQLQAVERDTKKVLKCEAESNYQTEQQLDITANELIVLQRRLEEDTPKLMKMPEIHFQTDYKYLKQRINVIEGSLAPILSKKDGKLALSSESTCELGCPSELNPSYLPIHSCPSFGSSIQTTQLVEVLVRLNQYCMFLNQQTAHCEDPSEESLVCHERLEPFRALFPDETDKSMACDQSNLNRTSHTIVSARVLPDSSSANVAAISRNIDAAMIKSIALGTTLTNDSNHLRNSKCQVTSLSSMDTQVSLAPMSKSIISYQLPATDRSIPSCQPNLSNWIPPSHSNQAEVRDLRNRPFEKIIRSQSKSMEKSVKDTVNGGIEHRVLEEDDGPAFPIGRNSMGSAHMRSSGMLRQSQSTAMGYSYTNGGDCNEQSVIIRQYGSNRRQYLQTVTSSYDNLNQTQQQYQLVSGTNSECPLDIDQSQGDFYQEGQISVLQPEPLSNNNGAFRKLNKIKSHMKMPSFDQVTNRTPSFTNTIASTSTYCVRKAPKEMPQTRI